MMQPAESLVRKDATASHGTSPPAWRSLPEPQMRAVLVVITYIFREQSFQSQIDPGFPYHLYAKESVRAIAFGGM
jgi:hypothetical protein